MIRLTDLSTGISLDEKDKNDHLSTILKGSQLFTRVSLRKMGQNLIQEKRWERLKIMKNWAITADLVPRPINSKSIVYFRQLCAKGFNKIDLIY